MGGRRATKATPTDKPTIEVTSTGLTNLKVGEAVASASIIYTLSNGEYAAAGIIKLEDFTVGNLKSKTTYYVYARAMMNVNYEAGTAKVSAGIETAKAPAVKTITVGSQTGALQVGGGTAQTATFPVTTTNIANSTYTPTITGAPVGVTVQGSITQYPVPLRKSRSRILSYAQQTPQVMIPPRCP